LRVEVLIPHFNRADALRAVLEALRGQTRPAPVCVADNASTDRTAEMLAGEFAEVRHLRLDRNYGFGVALNRAVASGDAELLVLLNNDTVPAPTFLEAVERAHDRSGAEMVAACLLSRDGRIDSLGVEIDTALNAYDVGHGQPADQPPPALPLAPTGGAGAYTRAAFERVGGFDERIFAYLEDVDLGIRMRLAGMRCELARDAVAVHEHAGTLGSGSAQKNFLLGRARGYLLWKHRANLDRRERIRGLVTDAVVYAGQVVIDRNLGSIRGRLSNRRELRRAARPAPERAWARVPASNLSLAAGLGRRLGRRR
jgi:GT2 family glycosyltransferase